MGKKTLTTKAYGIFVTDYRNRIIRENKRFKELEKSMREHGWLEECPLYATQNGKGVLRVVDGHRRLVIAEKLGIAVHYKIGKEIPIHVLQISDDPWIMEDYLNYYVQKGNPNYIKIKQYRQRYGIGLSNCVQLLGNVRTKGAGGCDTTMIEDFKKGLFEVGDPSHAEQVAEIVSYCKNVCELPFSTNRSFVTAISKLLFTEVDAHTLMTKLRRYKTRMDKQPSIMHFVKNIEEIYNLSNRNPKNLYFQVQQLGRLLPDESAAT